MKKEIKYKWKCEECKKIVNIYHMCEKFLEKFDKDIIKINDQTH